MSVILIKRPLLGRRHFALWCSLTLIGVVGCGDLIPPRPPIQSSREAIPAEEESVTVTPVEETLPAEFEGDWSEWYVYRFGNRIVGTTEVNAQTVINEDVLKSGISQVEYLRDERLVYRSGRVSFLRRSQVSSIESVKGGLISFRADSMTGPMSAVVTGTRSNAVMSIRRVVDGASENSRLEWSDANHGLFAVEQSLRRSPMSADQTRRLQVLAPSLAAVGVIEMKCRGESSVAMLDGAYRLMREIDVVTYQDGQQVDLLVVWTDENGIIEKTLRPQIRLESFRTDRSTAGDLFAVTDYDHVDVAVDGAWSDDSEVARATFVVNHNPPSETEQADRFRVPAFGNQSVDSSGDQFLVSVVGADADALDRSDSDSIAMTADTRSTRELDFDQSTVKQMADSIGDLPKPDLATELAQMVKTVLSLSSQHALQPASQTVKTRRGGRADHAILLASVMRARGIPARVAVGLSRNQEVEGSTMRLNAWVFALVDGVWVSFDPVTAQTNRADQLCLGVVVGEESVSAAYVDVFESLSAMTIEIQSDESK